MDAHVALRYLSLLATRHIILRSWSLWNPPDWVVFIRNQAGDLAFGRRLRPEDYNKNSGYDHRESSDNDTREHTPSQLPTWALGAWSRNLYGSIAT